MKHKVPTASEAVALFRDDNTLANTGFVGCGAPDTCWGRSNNVFLETRSPRNLTLLIEWLGGYARARNRMGFFSQRTARRSLHIHRRVDRLLSLRYRRRWASRTGAT
jgi:acyl CoA:acetate/3-ketoacid CoA transferase